METKATMQMVAIAKRIAAQNGVSVSDVLAKFSRGVQKTAHTRADFFWGNSDISLAMKNHARAAVADGLDAGRIVVARIRPIAISRTRRAAVK